jgi:hypothetical protein
MTLSLQYSSSHVRAAINPNELRKKVATHWTLCDNETQPAPTTIKLLVPFAKLEQASCKCFGSICVPDLTSLLTKCPTCTWVLRERVWYPIVLNRQLIWKLPDIGEGNILRNSNNSWVCVMAIASLKAEDLIGQSRWSVTLGRSQAFLPHLEWLRKPLMWEEKPAASLCTSCLYIQLCEMCHEAFCLASSVECVLLCAVHLPASFHPVARPDSRYYF